MTTTTRTTRTISPSQPNRSPSSAATEHYSTETNKNQNPNTRTTRSRESHLCITIEGCGQASGLPRTAAAPVDLLKIISELFGC